MRPICLRLIVSLLTFGIGLALPSLHSLEHRAGVAPAEVPVEVKKENRIATTQIDNDDCPPRFEKKYFNYDYGYSVAIPNGMIAYGACHTNHGFVIDLEDPTSNPLAKEDGPRAGLWVDAYYDVGNLTFFDEAMSKRIDFLKSTAAGDLLNVGTLQLARLTALRVVIRYQQDGKTMIRDKVVVSRKTPGKDTDIIYSIELKTPEYRYDQDSAVIDQIQNSWRWHRRP